MVTMVITETVMSILTVTEVKTISLYEVYIHSIINFQGVKHMYRKCATCGTIGSFSGSFICVHTKTVGGSCTKRTTSARKQGCNGIKNQVSRFQITILLWYILCLMLLCISVFGQEKETSVLINVNSNHYSPSHKAFILSTVVFWQTYPSWLAGIAAFQQFCCPLICYTLQISLLSTFFLSHVNC